MDKKIIEVEVKDGVFLVVEQSLEPFNKEVGIYLKSNGTFQDIALVSPDYEVDENANVHYSDNELLVRIWGDENSDDYTKTANIPFREEFK